MAMFNSKLLVYQRVWSLAPEDNLMVFLWFSYAFPMVFLWFSWPGRQCLGRAQHCTPGWPEQLRAAAAR